MSKSFELDLSTNPAWMSRLETPVIMAGPCSAESEEQVVETARALKENERVSLFRAGIWKPRTRPGNFEGIGAEALAWMKTVKEETGLKTIVEVANANHVYEALKHGIDELWVGARSTVSPFSVQEVADALKGVDVPVWVKNPVNPDLQLWLGAMERLNKAGIKRIGAIHRGFSTFEKTPFRNIPKWNIAIELKRVVPNLPIVCDPSHICGNRHLIGTVAQRALDLAMNGLMIETHPDPDNALSDAKQQITPDMLNDILAALTFRQPGDVPETSLLEVYRSEIDGIDNGLIQLLAQRNEISAQIGHYKQEKNMTIYQVKRWDHLFEDRIRRATNLGLDEQFVKDFYQMVHANSIRIQERIMNKAAQPAAKTKKKKQA